MWPALVNKVPHLNIAIALSLIAMGLLVWFLGKPKIREQRFAQWTFVFWVAQWLMIAAVYTLTIVQPSYEQRLLAISDMQTILVIASAWALFEGQTFNLNVMGGLLGGLYIALQLWNIGLYPGTTAEPLQRILWAGPSETLAVISMPLVGLALLMRYHAWAALLFLFTIVYGGLQQAAYSATVLSVTGVPNTLSSAAGLFVTLAAGKALIGGMFYGLFFLPLSQYQSTVSPLTEQDEDQVRGKIRLASGWALGSVLVPVAVSLVTAWLSAR